MVVIELQLNYIISTKRSMLQYHALHTIAVRLGCVLDRLFPRWFFCYLYNATPLNP